jgi:hypothetical protein
MWKLDFYNDLTEQIFYSAQNFIERKENVKNIGISKLQLLNLYQATDVENYKSLNDLHNGFNKEVGTRKNIKISKEKLKNAVFLLLAHSNGIIKFT